MATLKIKAVDLPDQEPTREFTLKRDCDGNLDLWADDTVIATIKDDHDGEGYYLNLVDCADCDDLMEMDSDNDCYINVRREND